MNAYLKGACGCSTGKVRRNNEDNFLFSGTCMNSENQGLSQILTDECAPDVRHFAAIFDGMGGENFGELASFAAANAMRRELPSVIDSRRPIEEDLDRLCQLLNVDVVNAAKSMLTTHMGTTMVAFCFTDGKAYSCNLGDSRAYVLRGGKLKRMSLDHVESRSQGKKAPLTQHLGIDPEELLLEPHIASCTIEQGDQYLLCSDGLTDMLTEDQIGQIMAGSTDPQECVQRLITAALANGGRDNITVIVYRALSGKPKQRGGRRGVAAAALCCVFIGVFLLIRVGNRSNAGSGAQDDVPPQTVTAGPTALPTFTPESTPTPTFTPEPTPAPTFTPDPTSVPTPEATETPVPSPESEFPELTPEPWSDEDAVIHYIRSQINWTLEDGVLTLSGTGDVADLWASDTVPWYGQQSLIVSIRIEGGITGLEGAGLWEYTSLQEIRADMYGSGYYSEKGVLFNRSRKSLVCYPAGKTDSDYQMPDDILIIEENAFRGNVYLKTLILPESRSLARVCENAFLGCASLHKVVSPDGRRCFANVEIENGNDALLYAKRSRRS